MRDFAQVKGDGTITVDIAREALDMLEVDELGLDHVDRTMLRTMMEKFGGGPVGLDTLAASTGEDASTIEDVYEPYLLQLGFLMRTPRGRVCTQAAYDHMGVRMPRNANPAAEGQMKMDIFQRTLILPGDKNGEVHPPDRPPTSTPKPCKMKPLNQRKRHASFGSWRQVP